MPVTNKVGTEIEAQCGRCHDATNHVIVTVEKGKPKRAQCRQCDAQHLYRAPKGPEEPRAKKAGKKKGEKKDDVLAAFEKAMEAALPDPAAAYSMSAQFQQGQKLSHKTFGDGVVTGIVRNNVIEVTFRDGTRKLAVNR